MRQMKQKISKRIALGTLVILVGTPVNLANAATDSSVSNAVTSSTSLSVASTSAMSIANRADDSSDTTATSQALQTSSTDTPVAESENATDESAAATSSSSSTSSTKQATKASTDAAPIASGTLGTVKWSIDPETNPTGTGNAYNVLHLGAGNFGSALTAYQAKGNSPWAAYNEKTMAIVVDGTITANAGTSYSYLFSGLASVSSITGLEKMSFTGVTNLDSMFWGDGALATISDLSNADFSSVTSMNGTFNGCSPLQTLNVSNWDVSHVTNMDTLFYNCGKLTTLDVSRWNVSNVTSMATTFGNCSSLAALDVSRWNVGNVASFRSVFLNCSGISSLDLASWQMKSGAATGSMLMNMSALRHLKLGTGTVITGAGLPTVSSTSPYNGKWVLQGTNQMYTSTELMAQYTGGTMAGDYYWASDATVTVKYVDESGTELHDSTMMYGAPGGSYTTTPLEIDGYQVVTTPTNATGTYQSGTSITVTYVYSPQGAAFSGLLTTFDFGKHPISSVTETYGLASKTGDLKIKSPGSTGWTLSAKLETPFKGKNTGTILNATLLYQDAAGVQTTIGTDQPAQLMTSTGTTNQEINVSGNWLNGTEGLKLKVPAGAVMYQDSYTGTVTWNLTNGVDNK